MRVLFVHQNFPAQYVHLAPALAARGDEVTALAIEGQKPIPGVRIFRYKPQRGSSPNIHPWVTDIETKVIRGEAAAQAALKLKSRGYEPDVICAHPGWGEALFLKDVFPKARLLAFIEFWYKADGADFGFDPEFSEDGTTGRCRLRMKNANSLLNLDVADWCVSPTEWQRSTVPAFYQDRVSVIHDGIDTARIRPDPSASVKLAKRGVVLRPGDEVITFVNRNMEPYRGFHIFMRALPEILRRRPNAVVLIVGGDEVSYGKKLENGQTWRKKMLAEVGDQLDMQRVRFVGRISHDDFVSMLQVSAAHIYLTYPFVLSWSMLEAMAAGCLIIGSATPPVQEVIRDGENGLLVDFFSPQGLAETLDRALDSPQQMAALRQRARETVVARYDLQRYCLPRHVALVDAVADGRLPPDLDAAVARYAASASNGSTATTAPSAGTAPATPLPTPTG